MDTFEVIKSPWEELFFYLVSEANESLQMACPFIKKTIAEKIINAKKNEVKLFYITSFKLINFYRGSSDFEALKIILQNNGFIKNYQRLHSKIYIFDKSQAIVTSANLTEGGLKNNYEYGILVKDEFLVKEIVRDFYKIYEDTELTGKLSYGKIEKAEKIINSIPKEKLQLILDDSDEKNDVINLDTNSVISQLTGWKLAVFKCLLEIDKSIFTLSDVYKYKHELQKQYPKNHNVEEKIRQQLQFLRDLGLIEFKGKGLYKKLWN